MDRIDLKEFIHACISLIYHVKPHHGRKSSQSENFPEIESGPVISTAKNGNFLILNLHHDTSFKWIFAQHESWRSCSPISKKSKNSQFPCVVGKLWSNRFQKILNFKGPYLSNRLANFGGVFSYKSHLIPSFQKYKFHVPKLHQSKWHILTFFI